MKTNFKNTLSFLFLFLVAGISLHAQVIGQSDPVIMDRVVAVVGKYPILQSDIENQIIDMRRNGMDIPGDPKCYVLEGLLVSKLLLSQAEIDSIEVTDDEVERMVDSKLQEFVFQVGSEANLESYFKKSMVEIKKDLMKPQKEQMISQKMKDEITKGMTITPSEVQKFYKKFPSNEIPLISETMEIREIIIKPEVSEAEITRVQNRLNEFRERILKGEDIRTLAVLYSDDQSTATRGGELGMTPRSMLVPEFAAVAFNLKVNDLSRVVKTDFGYHIMQLIERRGDLINVRHILLTPKPTIELKLAVRNRLDSIAQAIRENKITFEEAALRYSQEKETRSNGGLLVNNGGLQTSNPQNANTTWFEPKELPAEVMAAIRNLKVGEISPVFESRDNNNQPVYKIISIKSRRPAHKADLKMDYPYLQTLALKDKEQVKLGEWVGKKQKSMFIRIDPDFRNCEFTHPGWIK
ncbi:MAG: peptidylprolyl isomerase [Bacteroidota bacterium]